MKGDFYGHIQGNKWRTRILLAIFFLFTLVLAWIVGIVGLGLDGYSAAILGFIISFVYAMISYFASSKIALMTAGAKEVDKSKAPELYRLVENLCITAGLPMPKVYVIDDESPNAFATGRDPGHAAVAFTTGLLKRLDKNELEGVIAHELSHIKNYDIRVMTIVVVLVGLIALLSDILIRLPMSRSSNNSKGSGATLAIFLVGVLLGLLSPVIAHLIRFAVSRSREYLADASGVQLTRYPEGLASALEKISSADVPLRRANHATAHLYISNPFKKGGFMNRLFSTHPPAEDRIKRIREMM